jgi:hypothetical protein
MGRSKKAPTRKASPVEEEVLGQKSIAGDISVDDLLAQEIAEMNGTNATTATTKRSRESVAPPSVLPPKAQK